MNIPDPQRRRFLGQAATLACVAVAPVTLIACRDGESSNPAPAEGTRGQDSGPGKLSKAQADYQDSPNGSEQCSGCQHFNAEAGTCAVVQGDIAADGWCTLWVAAS